MTQITLTAQTALTAYQRGYQEQLEKLGFSFNPIQGIKNLFGGKARSVATQPTQLMKPLQTTRATQLPFAKTRISEVPGQAQAPNASQASYATQMRLPIWSKPSQFPAKGSLAGSRISSAYYNKALQGKRMPGLLADPVRQQHSKVISRKADEALEKYYQIRDPSKAGKPFDWNIEATEAKRMYPGDAEHIKGLQEDKIFEQKYKALQNKNVSFDPSKASMSSVPFSWVGNKQTMIPDNLKTVVR